MGSSFYKSIDFYNLKSESNADFAPTSRFGIGILSCFMVADTLIVDTKRVYAPHKSSDALNIIVEGQESIFWIKEGMREIPGTTTKLILRKGRNPWDKMSDNEFIKSVESVIPNPPFRINIRTATQDKGIDEYTFNDITTDTLKDNSWKSNENIIYYYFPLNNSNGGIQGSATIAILESRGKPVSSVELNSKIIEIEGEEYELEKKINISENAIVEIAKTITINDEGDISEDSSINKLARSNSRLSLHGIEIPITLFPESWRMNKNQVKISWPFLLVLLVDVCGNRDLDLNSPRTEIIMSEKWIDFEEYLAYMICDALSKSVDIDYWLELKKILEKSSKSDPFLRGLNKVQL